ncbi:threonylcarbamoyl-AMP synthase [Candidatus Bipolaricaulota bacterium]|nr:threonylcarbamoyl-AMP synthase [Candidatus Bipolaricaulota bacterium]
MIEDDIDGASEIGEAFKEDVLMVFPTDTVYGLGGNARDESVVSRIYRVKQRSEDKPLSLHLFSRRDVSKYVPEISEKQQNIIDKLLPGPYTIILPANSNAPDVSVSREKKVGIRVPDSNSFRNLEENIDFPLVGTSVNKSGEPPMTDFDRIVDEFGGIVDLFIESPEEMSGETSTVLDLTFDPPKVLRGDFSPEELKD